jgi:diguanylate cyclase (GGDEF)-like protein
MRRVSFAPGEAMFREGEAGEELFAVVSGLVSVSVLSPDGEAIELSRVGPGAFFGEMAILERATRSATCAAVEATECLVLKAEDFQALIAETPNAAVGVLDRMLGIAAGRLLSTGSFLSQMVQWGDDARKRAITDAATGLFNRRYLEDSWDGLVARARREGSPLSYAMFDLDRFGKLNAAHGAEFCDRLIVTVAGEFRRVFGEEDILVRYGGDEFSFILPCADLEAERKCEAVCHALRSLSFPEKPGLSISCSIGLSHLEECSGGDELKERADKALYAAKEGGRDRAVVWPDRAVEPPKRDIAGVRDKNRVIGNVIKAIDERDSFLIIGHKDPDEDCVSSMVAFALLLTKFNKKVAIVLGSQLQGNFDYLLKMCRYNFINIVREAPLPRPAALVLLDTPKPAMMDRRELYAELEKDPSILKIELDHHLEADSRYWGDPDYRLVYEASSTCEIIGLLATKIANRPKLLAKYEIDELLSRNIVLAVLSGMIGDSQMGRYLKTRRERWFYNRFSALFEKMLECKTVTGSGNFRSKEQVFDALAALSNDEESCFRFMSRKAADLGPVRVAVLGPEDSRHLFATYGNETVVAVSKALVDRLAEEGGKLGLVGYYDDPALSPFVQFRLRRSQAFTDIDLREALARLDMTNGGGHPGAVGFRVEREKLPDIEASSRVFAAVLGQMAGEGAGKPKA